MTTQRLIENNRFVKEHSEFSPSVRLLAQQSADELARLSSELEQHKKDLQFYYDQTQYLAGENKRLQSIIESVQEACKP